MEAKLTLKLDKDAIETAKTYAKEQGTSVSRMVEEYFKNLQPKKRKTPEEIIRSANLKIDWDNIEISEEIKALRTGKRLPVDYDWKAERNKYWEEKYK